MAIGNNASAFNHEEEKNNFLKYTIYFLRGLLSHLEICPQFSL